MECVGDPPVICDAFHSGIRFVRVGENRIRHEWVELANVPEAIDDLFPAAGELKRQLYFAIQEKKQALNSHKQALNVQKELSVQLARSQQR